MEDEDEDEDEDEMRLGYFFSDGFLEIWFCMRKRFVGDGLIL